MEKLISAFLACMYSFLGGLFTPVTVQTADILQNAAVCEISVMS